jgi:hypothetical protein
VKDVIIHATTSTTHLLTIRKTDGIKDADKKLAKRIGDNVDS